MPNPILGISADHIAPAGGAFEPQRKNNFTLIIPLSGTGQRDVQMQIHSCSFPLPGVGEISIPYGNEERWVAGQAVFSALNFVVKDFVGAKVIRAMREWRRTVYDPATGVIGLARNYKKDCTLILFGPDGSYQRSWACIGVWPSSMTTGNFDYNNAANNLITVTLELDKAYYLGESGAGAGAGGSGIYGGGSRRSVGRPLTGSRGATRSIGSGVGRQIGQF